MQGFEDSLLVDERSVSNNNTVYVLKLLIAGKKIEIECKYKNGFRDCKDYLACFDRPDFIVRASDEEIAEMAASIIGKEKLNDLSFSYAEFGDIESIIVYQRIAEELLKYNTILMHGAAIAIRDNCYIFTAPSGTGKTTHILNWLKLIPETIVVNGDKPLIDVDNKVVYGTPWCGKEKMNTNISVPLAGIISLERGQMNSIARISFKEILPLLLQQCYLSNNVDLYRKAINLVGRFSDIACYRLVCNMNVDSAKVAYDGLMK